MEPAAEEFVSIKGVGVFAGGLVMAFFCQQCGNALHPSALFCPGCGAATPMAQPMPGRPLIRPHVGRQIGGVCLALAQANGWDVAMVRILTVIGFIFSSGLIGVAYVAAWIGIPEDAAPYRSVSGSVSSLEYERRVPFWRRAGWIR